MFIAGAAIQWLRDGLGLIETAPIVAPRAQEAATARSRIWCRRSWGSARRIGMPAARGAIVGITRGTTRDDIVRAALDWIAYQVRDVIVAMESDSGHRISELRADGGAVGESLPDAIPGRHIGQARAASGDDRDHRARRRDARRDGVRAYGRHRRIWRCFIEARKSSSPGCPPTSARASSTDGMMR